MSQANINLREIQFFSQLEESDAALLGKFTKNKKFPQGASLLKSGQICSHVYLVLDCVVQRTAMDQPPNLLHEGEAIGIIEVLKGQPMDADYKIEQEGSALVIPATALEEILLLSPSLGPTLVNALK